MIYGIENSHASPLDFPGMCHFWTLDMYALFYLERSQYAVLMPHKSFISWIFCMVFVLEILLVMPPTYSQSTFLDVAISCAFTSSSSTMRVHARCYFNVSQTVAEWINLGSWWLRRNKSSFREQTTVWNQEAWSLRGSCNDQAFASIASTFWWGKCFLSNGASFLLYVLAPYFSSTRLLLIRHCTCQSRESNRSSSLVFTQQTAAYNLKVVD